VGWRLVVDSVVEMSDGKNRERDGASAVGGRRLMGGHNNQLKVGVDGGRGVREETLLGRNVWGVLSLRTGRRIEGE
jgi:hypothetical protein